MLDVPKSICWAYLSTFDNPTLLVILDIAKSVSLIDPFAVLLCDCLQRSSKQKKQQKTRGEQPFGYKILPVQGWKLGRCKEDCFHAQPPAMPGFASPGLCRPNFFSIRACLPRSERLSICSMRTFGTWVGSSFPEEQTFAIG